MMPPPLPAELLPAAPFPLVIAQSHTSEFVAPGVRRATYRLQTSEGPLVVNVVAIDPREPTVRFGVVVANDRLISDGETVSSMARRSKAVAGVNADYFDIGNTNQPLGAVVSGGALLRTPSKRVVLDVRTDRSVHFEQLGFSGEVRYGDAAVPLTTVNEWPPQGGAGIVTPVYGQIKPAPGVALAELVPADPVHLDTTIAGTYRVASIADAAAQRVTGTLLAFGPAAKALAPPPASGDSVVVAADTTPSLDSLQCAVGGGPLLLADGRLADDPNSPAPEETDVRFPVSGAARTAAGELLLASVDGRQPGLSIGATRPDFAQLLLAFGATDAMAFDSGGSATLVARVLGERDASVLNSPSDGQERAVADGFFIYSDAPLGPPAQLVVRPSPIVALPRATVSVRLARVDAAGHALGIAHLKGGDVVHTGDSSTVVKLTAGGVSARVPVEVVARLARLDIEPDVRDPNPGGAVTFTATGFDDDGRVVDVGGAVRWGSDRGRFDAPGSYRAGRRDARIFASAGGARASFVLRVGRRAVALPLFDASRVSAWHAASAPPGEARALAFPAGKGEMQVPYDFSGDARAAYANGDVALPGEPLSFSIDVAGTGSAVGVRAAFVNRFGERRALTLATAIDWEGWQTRTIELPPDLNPPVRLVSLYVVDSLANAPTRAAGAVAFRRARVVIAGTP
jgi:exopolysaccharide biosynthesis protein